MTSDTAQGYDTTLISRDLSPQLEHWTCQMAAPLKLPVKPPVTEMIQQMAKMMALALLFVYFVMVAQFQSLLSPSLCCSPFRWPLPAV